MRDHYHNTIKVKRLKTLSGNKRNYVATATADASIQPLGKNSQDFDKGMFGTKYVAYCDDAVPAQKGDLVTDENGNKYTIEAIVVRDYGCFPYKMLTLKTTD